MAVVADFLKGTVEESLKKILQPAGLVPATILVLLNLGFIYPAARTDIVAVKAYANLDAGWQLVVAATLALAVGYLLLHAANWVIAVLAGQNWRASGINWLLRAWHLHQRNDLSFRTENPLPDDNRAGLRWQLATRYPSLPEPSRYIEPTRLGNTLVATQHILSRRYGIDMAALWSQMQSVKDVKEAPAIAAVKDAKATLDLLANLVFVLLIFVAEALLYFGYRERWDDVLTAFLILPLAYVTYRVADTSARAWGNAVEVTLDLHRDELRTALGVREGKDAAEENELWRKASRFFLPGSDEPAGELFEKAPRGKATVAAASSLEVVPVADDVVDGVTRRTSAGGETSFDLRSVEYVFIVSRKDEAAAQWAGADFVVEDPRVTSIDALPGAVRDGVATAKSQQTGDGLRWRITGLQKGASLLIAYRLPVWRLVVESRSDPQLTFDGTAFRLALPGATEVELTFVGFYDFSASERPAVVHDGVAVRLSPTAGRLTTGPIAISERSKTLITLPKEADGA